MRPNTYWTLSLALALAALPALALGGTTERVSVSSTGEQSNGDSYYPAISGGGRFVAFSSAASNLLGPGGDANAHSDIFVRDRPNGKTELVSVPSAGGQADGGSYSPAVTSDGRFVAFFSRATNLVAEADNNAAEDVFVRDRGVPGVPPTTELISVSLNGTTGNAQSDSPSLSDDGRYVVFESEATDLVSPAPPGAPGLSQIYLRDRGAGTTILVSAAPNGTAGNNPSGQPLISANGRYVTYMSFASNLVEGDTNGTADVFLYDTETRQTTRVSVASNGAQADGTSWDLGYCPVSPDGRYVAFASSAGNLVNLVGKVTRCIYLRDRGTPQTPPQTLLVSKTPGGRRPNGPSSEPSMSADGTLIAFCSSGSDIVGGDTNGVYDVFVYDRQSDTTTRVSVATGGAQSIGGRSLRCSLSPEGQFVAFWSEATNLVAEDTNGVGDSFIHDRGAAPPGITVSPTSGLVTSEAGAGDTFTVVLNTQPTADVTIALSSSDTTEGTVSPATLTFTPANWYIPQTVTVTGVDDAVPDGDVAYTIITAAAESGDLNYSGMDAADVWVTNLEPRVLVTSITYALASGNKTLKVTIALRDNLGGAVVGASVAAELRRNGTVVATWTGPTGTGGTVTFQYSNAPAGTYTTTVTAVHALPLTWNGVTPPNTYTKTK